MTKNTPLYLKAKEASLSIGFIPTRRKAKVSVYPKVDTKTIIYISSNPLFKQWNTGNTKINDKWQKTVVVYLEDAPFNAQRLRDSSLYSG